MYTTLRDDLSYRVLDHDGSLALCVLRASSPLSPMVPNVRQRLVSIFEALCRDYEQEFNARLFDERSAGDATRNFVSRHGGSWWGYS